MEWEQEAAEWMDMEIRLMCEGDVPAVRELEELCFADAWSEALLLQGLGSRLDTFWVLEEDGKICGYANLRVIAGEGEVERIAVHPDFRGGGFGRKLMEQMVSSGRMQGVTDMTLEVRAGNETAIKLYASCGFQKEAVRRGYYREPVEDAVIMWNRGI